MNIVLPASTVILAALGGFCLWLSIENRKRTAMFKKNRTNS